MNKTYKIQLPRNKEAQNIRTNIKDGIIEVEVELKEKWEPRDGEICFAMTSCGMWKFILIYGKITEKGKQAIKDYDRKRNKHNN